MTNTVFFIIVFAALAVLFVLVASLFKTINKVAKDVSYYVSYSSKKTRQIAFAVEERFPFDEEEYKKHGKKLDKMVGLERKETQRASSDGKEGGCHD